jgi:hypothetical protein
VELKRLSVAGVFASPEPGSKVCSIIDLVIARGDLIDPSLEAAPDRGRLYFKNQDVGAWRAHLSFGWQQRIVARLLQKICERIILWPNMIAVPEQ